MSRRARRLRGVPLRALSNDAGTRRKTIAAVAEACERTRLKQIIINRNHRLGQTIQLCVGFGNPDARLIVADLAHVLRVEITVPRDWTKRVLAHGLEVIGRPPGVLVVKAIKINFDDAPNEGAWMVQYVEESSSGLEHGIRIANCCAVRYAGHVGIGGDMADAHKNAVEYWERQLGINRTADKFTAFVDSMVTRIAEGIP